jgi:3-oxoacyl-[acyl-carrier-protein] synthase II
MQRLSPERRIVLTGLGAVTPLGLDAASTWAGLAAGRSGIAPIAGWDASAHDCRFAGQVKGFDPGPHFASAKEARRADRYAQLAMAAAREAVRHAGLDPASLPPERVGVLVGSGIGGLQTMGEQDALLVTRGPGRISPFMIPMMISNMAGGLISMAFGFQGPNFAVVTACATSNNAIGEAWRLIRDDEADVILAGGSEAACTPLGMGGFDAMKAMSTRNGDPARASRPFDRDRDGFVLGEGAGVVIVEELEHAKKRGANILAELTGYGLSADAHHMTTPAPGGAGAVRAMRNALRRAGVAPEEVDYINAHATSTPVGDAAEAEAIRTVFGDAAGKIAISSTKSMTGHLLGAAGAVELIACIRAIQENLAPPTINLENPDPDLGLDYVPHVARERRIDRALSNSFGFGGHNASLLVERFRG